MDTARPRPHPTRAPAARAAVDDPRVPRPRPAHGRARRDDRERRDALDRAVARVLARRPPVARDGLLARRSAVVLFLGGRLSDLIGRKTTLQIGLHRVRPRVGARGRRAELRHARDRARDPGRLRRGARAGRARDGHDHVRRPRRARQGVRDLRLDRGGRRRHRAPVRRDPDDSTSTGDGASYVNLIFAGIAVAGTQLLLPRERGTSKSGLDLASTLLISSGLFAIVYGLSDAATNATNARTSLHADLAGVGVRDTDHGRVPGPRRRPGGAVRSATGPHRAPRCCRSRS